MKQEIYTKEELELFDLYDWFFEFAANFMFANSEDKKLADDTTKSYKKTKDDIIQFANKRFEDLDRMDKEKNDNLYIYHDVTCPKCKFFTSLLPVGTKKNPGGYTCPTFECPKCHTVFPTNHPVTVEETIKLMEAVLKTIKKNRLPMAQIKEGQTRIDELREAYQNVLDDNAVILNHHKEIKALVKIHLDELTVYKLNILSGNKSTEIN
jgi:hypothetical protein